MSFCKKAIDSVKNIIPLDVLYYLKYRSKFREKKSLDLKEGCPRIFLLDSPHYGNVGDQAIAYAIKRFAENYFKDFLFVDIQQEDLPHYIKDLKNKIKPDDIIFMVGGGNMGNRYKIFEAARRLVLNNFKYNKTVIFPQTLDYSNGLFGRLSMLRSKMIYNRHRRLIIMAREESSYKKMHSLYTNCQIILSPDIVLSLKEDISNLQRSGIGICLRSDCEQKLTEKDKTKIYQYVHASGKTVRELSASSKYDYITPDMRSDVVFSKISEISSCEMLITDRLHTMIFAFLSRTPCIVFNNSNGKIKGVFKWISDCKNIKFVESVDEMIKSESNMDFNYEDAVDLGNIFDEISEAIRKC